LWIRARKHRGGSDGTEGYQGRTKYQRGGLQRQGVSRRYKRRCFFMSWEQQQPHPPCTAFWAESNAPASTAESLMCIACRFAEVVTAWPIIKPDCLIEAQRHRVVNQLHLPVDSSHLDTVNPEALYSRAKFCQHSQASARRVALTSDVSNASGRGREAPSLDVR
jgi:hypothetical protein